MSENLPVPYDFTKKFEELRKRVIENTKDVDFNRKMIAFIADSKDYIGNNGEIRIPIDFDILDFLNCFIDKLEILDTIYSKDAKEK